MAFVLNNSGEDVYAVAYGRQITAGKVVLYQKEGNRVKFAAILGLGEMDGIEKVYYAGQEMDELDGSGARQWKFHPGKLSTGFADPDQGRPHFWDAANGFTATLDFTFSGRAYLEVLLPESFSETEDEPTRLKVLLRGRRVKDFDSTGEQTGFGFSSNPARVAADILLNFMGVNPVRIDWPSWTAFRDRCDELINWQKSDTETVQIPRFQANIAFPQAVAAATAFEQVMALCPGVDWQDVGVIKFLPTPDRTPVHHFGYDLSSGNHSNIVAGSFSATPRAPREKFNRLRAKFRDISDPYFAETSIKPVERPQLQQQTRTISDPGVILFGVMHQSQAERIMESRMRRQADLGLFVQWQAFGDSFHVSKGDVVTLSHEVTGWKDADPVQFIVIEETFESSLKTADLRQFVGQVYAPDWYSDTAHGAVQPRIVTDLPVQTPGSIIARGRAVRGLDGNSRYRGRDRTVVDRSRLQNVRYDDVVILENGDKVQFNLYGEVNNSDGAAHADSIDGVRITVHDKFGNVVYGPNVYPWTGSGLMGGGVYPRLYADPREEAVFKIEVRNIYGWALPQYITWRPWSGVAGVLLNNLPALINPNECPLDLKATPISETKIRLDWKPPADSTDKQAVFIKSPNIGYEGWTWVEGPPAPLSASASSYVYENAHLIEFAALDFTIWRDSAVSGEFKSNNAYVRPVPQFVGAGSGEPESALLFSFEDENSALSAPLQTVAFQVPYDCTILNWSLSADAAGSCVLDVWKSASGSYPPTVTGTITASAKPSLSAQSNATDATLTGWTKALSKNEWILAKLESVSGIKKLKLKLQVSKNQSVSVARPIPTSLTGVAVNATTVQLSWTRNAVDNAAVEVWEDAGLIATLTPGETTSYTRTVAAASTHAYKVRNKWADGSFSEFSMEVSVTTPPAVAVGSPTQLTADPVSISAVRLDWNNNGNTGAVTVKWRLAGNTSWNTVSVAGGSTTYTKTGLLPDTEYEFQVEIAGAISASNVASATTWPIIIIDPWDRGGGYGI